MIRKLEEDAREILSFMALNGLVANLSKTEFMIMNGKTKMSRELLRLIVIPSRGGLVVERWSDNGLF